VDKKALFALRVKPYTPENNNHMVRTGKSDSNVGFNLTILVKAKSGLFWDASEARL